MTECSITCGGMGTRKQERICNNPEPANGGANCVGLSQQDISCETPDCDLTSKMIRIFSSIVYIQLRNCAKRKLCSGNERFWFCNIF